MFTLLILIGALLLGQWLCGRLARRKVARMMRPADDWDVGDVDRWLALIEPFPLRDSPPSRSR
jgi:hypothetical protein